jgi:diguanylate cyclase (GGDEF)-like protein
LRDTLRILTELTVALHERLPLEGLLQRVVESAARVARTERASLRLLDPSGTRLLATCRAGEPLHENPNEVFERGEGLMGWIVDRGLALRTGDAEADPRFAPRPGMRERIGSFLGVPLVSGTVALGVISAVHPTHDYFDDEDEAALILLAGVCAPHIEIARLSRLASVDPLTGALNRRGLDEAFPVEGNPAASGERLAAVMIDLDHFKRVNDTWGHAVGDTVLREVARALAQVVRLGDAVVRYGGEEFVLLLRGVDLLSAARIAERTRTALSAIRVPVGGEIVRVTASAGIATGLAEARDDLIARADAAMYRAKQGGRDRTAIDDGRA